jgi:GLPGLI family protein
MKLILTRLSILLFAVLLSSNTVTEEPPKFQGQAFYFSKSSLELGKWGARLNEAQKKQIQARLKNRLEKTYVLTFNTEHSTFKEEEKLDAMSGATDSWGKNFSAGKLYKNVKNKELIQNQEFYGKKFLVKDNLQAIQWQMGTESKQIGNYSCFKATASIPKNDLEWYSFSWDNARTNEASDDEENTKEKEEEMVQIEAWYTPQIPVSHGPSEFWGLPGLILEINNGNTIMLCSKIVMNPDEIVEIEAPEKGKIINKEDYQKTVVEKMKEFRNNRMRRRG